MASSTRTARPPLGLAALVLAVGVVFVAPFAYIVWRNAELGTDVVEVLFDRHTLTPLQRSLRLAVAVSLSTAVIATALAWLTIRTDLPGRRAWRLLAPLPLVFPSFVGATALLAGFAKGGLVAELLEAAGIGWSPDVRGFGGAWGVLTLFTYPYVYLPVAARMATLPASIEESARLLGRSPWGVFATVVLPQVWSSITAGSLLVFLYSISDFGAVTLLGYDTLTEQIFADKLFDQPRAMGLSLVLGAVALAVVAAERTLERRRRRVESVRSRGLLTVPLGRWRPAALAFVGGFLGAALIGPLAVLGFWAWRGLASQSAGIGMRTDIGSLVGPTVHTAEAGLIAGFAAVAVVLPLAWLISRYRWRPAGAANSMVVAGFALPGLVIALSLVFFTVDTPILSSWYQSLPLLILAYVLHFGAQATRAAQVAVDSVPRRFGEVAATLGVSRVRRFAGIEMPLMAPGLLTGAALVMLSTMKELPATLLLAPIGFDTLATEIWDAGERGALAQGALASLVLVALSAVLTWLVVIRRIEHH